MTVQPLSGRSLLFHRIVQRGGFVLLAAILIGAFVAAGRSSRVSWLSKATTAELLEQSKENPDDEELNLVLDRHLREDGKYDQAYALMSRLVKEFPNSVRSWDHYAKDSAETGRVLNALDGFLKEVRLDSSKGDADATIGSIYIRAGLVTDGLAAIDTARRVQQRVGVNSILWAQALDAKGRSQEAWNHIVESVNIDPTQDVIWATVGQLALKTDHVTDAIALMRRRINFSRMYDMASVRGPLARLLIATSHDSKTLDEAYYIAKAGANYQTADAQLPLAEVLVLKNDLNSARTVLENGLKMDVKNGLKTRNPDCVRMLADIAAKQGRSADAAHLRAELPPVVPETAALINARAAAKASPTDSGIQLAYAAALEQNNRFGDAAEVYEAVMDHEKGNVAASSGFARCRDEALHKLDAAEQADYNAKRAGDAESHDHGPK